MESVPRSMRFIFDNLTKDQVSIEVPSNNYYHNTEYSKGNFKLLDPLICPATDSKLPDYRLAVLKRFHQPDCFFDTCPFSTSIGFVIRVFGFL